MFFNEWNDYEFCCLAYYISVPNTEPIVFKFFIGFLKGYYQCECHKFAFYPKWCIYLYIGNNTKLSIFKIMFTQHTVSVMILNCYKRERKSDLT